MNRVYLAAEVFALITAIATWGILTPNVVDESRAVVDGPSVLVIGDSHLNTSFGTQLSKKLRAIPGAKVTVIGSCGRWSRAFVAGDRAHCGLRIIDEFGKISWGKGCKKNPCSSPRDTACLANACQTPIIGRLLTELKPDVVIVESGGNAIYRGTPKDKWRNIRGSLASLADQIVASGSACLWVTPPHGMNKSRWKMAKFSKFLTELHEGKCTLFYSGPEARPYLDYRSAAKQAGMSEAQHDKIHYDRLGKVGRMLMRRWAQEITDVTKTLIKAHGYGKFWRAIHRVRRAVFSLEPLRWL